MAVSVSAGSNPSGSPVPQDRSTSVFWRAVDFARNAALILGVYLAYAAVRHVTADDWATALSNGRTLLRIQDSLGLPSEASLQHAFFLPNPHVVRAANAFYMWGHFPITGMFMFWVWFKHRSHFGVIRNSIVTLTLSGLILHIVYPLAPPRFFPSFGFVDTARDFGPNPYDLAAARAANQIAAMPSLHVGWAVLVAISVIALCRSRWRFAALIHPAVTTGVVVLTANHYWADAIIAVILVLVAWVFTVRLARLGLFSFNPSRLVTSPPQKGRLEPLAASLRSSVDGTAGRN